MFGKHGQHFPYFEPQNWRIECMNFFGGKNGQHFPFWPAKLENRMHEKNWENWAAFSLLWHAKRRIKCMKQLLEKMGSIFPILTHKLENRMHEEKIWGNKRKRRTVLELAAHGPDGAMMICKMFPPAAPPPSCSHPWHRLWGLLFCAKDGCESGLRASYKVILT